MSHNGDGLTTTEEAVARVAAATVVGATTSLGASNVYPFSQLSRSRPPSVHVASSSDDSSSSDELEGEDLEAKKRRKEKMKAKIEKKAIKLMKKRIKEESDKHPFFGYHQVPSNYPPPSSQYPSSQFQSVHLGKPPYFDGTDYPKWAYDMKMHLYGLQPSIWEVVVVGVTPPKNGIPMAEQAQDYFRNAQAVRVITGSLCAQEFNKVRSIEIAKVIWDTLKEAHEGTDQLEYFIMLEEETMTQMFDRLMLLVSDIRILGSTDWYDHKVTKNMLRAFTPRNRTLATMIRRDPSFKTKTPNQLLGEILHQELVERDVAKSLSMRMNKSLALNTSSSTMIESCPKALKSKKEDSSEEGSTDEETAFAIRNYKKFLKKKAFKKNGDDRKKTSQRRCYEHKKVGHFIADCPHKKKKEMEEKRFKDKSKDYKKKYQGQAHVGQE
uniref:CCHC-type domain-containing protein n=1 Tax=Setaria italica TaxID=4555 RepID=K3ZMI5_SETIT